MIQQMLAIWCLVPLLFLKPAWTSGSSWFTYCWSLAWRILSSVQMFRSIVLVENGSSVEYKVYKVRGRQEKKGSIKGENLRLYYFSQLSSVALSCPTLWDPMDCSTPGLPVPHHLPEFAQVHVHWISDAIQPNRHCLKSLVFGHHTSNWLENHNLSTKGLDPKTSRDTEPSLHILESNLHQESQAGGLRPPLDKVFSAFIFLWEIK